LNPSAEVNEMQDINKFLELMDRAKSNIQTHTESYDAELATIVEAIDNFANGILRVEKELESAVQLIASRKDHLSELKRQLKGNEKMNQALQKEITKLKTKYGELQTQIQSTDTQLTDIDRQLTSTEQKLNKKTLQLQDISNQVQSIEKKLDETREVNEKQINAKKLERDEAQRELDEFRGANGVADFILAGLSNPPELEFIALLIRRTEMTLEALKTESRISSKDASQLVDVLQQKGVIEVRSDGNIRFLKRI
jgi:chromosome segregation ATPase